MSARFGLRALALLTASTVGALTIAGTACADNEEKVLLKGSTTASYFWDDASGRAGDTGLPASGKPMQKGLAASPSWPLLTEGYVIYKGKKLPFFVGDRGPGTPSNNGIMLDLDAKTFAELTGGTFNPDTLHVDGIGGQGHIDVDYVITKWGEGLGKKNYPVPFSSRAWARRDNNPAEPPKVMAEKKSAKRDDNPAELAQPVAEKKPAGVKAVAAAPPGEAEESSTVGLSFAAGALVLVGGGAVLGGAALGSERIRKFVKR
ncbi:hypothetical protein ACTMTI_12050 [Nonomuraea sp. H19]|uniref:hypothetical protein n=1 Tax=Nonomuraea sp. H19 TaxID=3452206 RepID=UPI003F8B7AED